MTKPLIGITLDWEDSKTYSIHQPWYALRDNYVLAVTQCGGTPILLPYDASSIDTYVELLDGLMITGGDYDIAPEVYGQNQTDGLRVTKHQRYLFERGLFETFAKTGKPLIGICAGMQLMNVAMGGSLFQDILTEVPSALDHEQWHAQISHHMPYHIINVLHDSKFAKLFGKGPYTVNSTHHQAIKNIGAGLLISAQAEDGIVEAIEIQDHPFAFGIEWHPEFMTSPVDVAIFQRFIECARESAR
jgi:putative glutamine amidotransferase